PPAASIRLIADMIAYTVEHVPKWNPINVCSYHLQEAGATPVQEIAYAMSNAIAVLDAVRERLGERAAERMPQVFGRISFFVNAGVRFIEEHAKLRAMGILWKGLGRERYGVQDERLLRFRYGVQVNSLGLTEAQPENNIQRIVLEALAVTLGRDARARSIQLPAWNEALGLPRPWDQQWSLRIQQVLAYETDLLEYADIFEGSVVMDGLVAELLEGARAEMAVVGRRGRGRAGGGRAGARGRFGGGAGELDGGDDRRGARRRDDGRVGRHAARGLRQLPRADGRGRGGGGARRCAARAAARRG